MKKVLLACGLFIFAGCSANYSQGYRCGVVRKFSRKGLLIKSWEGQLLLGGVVSQSDGKSSTLVNETWEFSVDPEAQHQENISEVVDEINKAADSGKRVKLYYNQDTWPKIRTSEDYEVYKVEILE